MGTAFIIVGIIIAIIFAMTTMAIIIINLDEQLWKMLVLLSLLGIMALAFTGLGIYFS